MANGGDDSEGGGRIAAATWRLSLRVSMSKRARRVLRAHPSKSCGQLPVIPGLEVFTIRSLGLTSLRGMGVHPEVRAPTRGTPRRWLPQGHPGGNPGANLKSISHRCHPILEAFVWELTKETIHLPLGCLQGGKD